MENKFGDLSPMFGCKMLLASLDPISLPLTQTLDASSKVKLIRKQTVVTSLYNRYKFYVRMKTIVGGLT